MFIYLFVLLRNCKPDKLHGDVGACVGNHSVLYAALMVESAKDQTYSAIKKEATDEYHGSDAD